MSESYQESGSRDSNDLYRTLLHHWAKSGSAEPVAHCMRVSAFTIALARAMNLGRGQIQTIARAAFLHDLGKTVVPSAILHKTGTLTPSEDAAMREHCLHGYEMLQRIPFLQDAAEIVYAHHEHWDGTGYPRRLRGDRIPLGARLLAIADALEEATAGGGARPSKSVQTARQEIASGSGSRFDPEVVGVFLTMPLYLWIELRRRIDPRDEDGPGVAVTKPKGPNAGTSYASASLDADSERA
jgi:putative nucleotidyltransferase with HDIG domain